MGCNCKNNKRKFKEELATKRKNIIAKRAKAEFEEELSNLDPAQRKAKIKQERKKKRRERIQARKLRIEARNKRIEADRKREEENKKNSDEKDV